MRTNVRAEFIVVGDGFNPEMVTEKLGIQPTQYWNKGDETNIPNVVKKDTCWVSSTATAESFDINNQLSQVVELLKDKRTVLQALRSNYHIEYLFMIVVEVSNNETPAIYFETEILEFASDIGAELHLDIYIL